MAAEIVLTFVVEELLKKVGSITIDGMARACGLKKDLEELGESTQRIQAILRVAEDKQDADEGVKTWLMKLQDIVYSAEDVLDEFAYESLRRQIQIQVTHKVRNFFSGNDSILFRLNMASKLKKVNDSLLNIERQASRELTLRAVATASRGVVPSTQLDRETDSLLDNSETGRTNDVEAIIKMLQVSSSNPSLITVVSIVGIGGLGKTTLAKLVLKEVKEKNQFGWTIWVCVSNAFDDKTILKRMLETLDKGASGLTTIEAILKDLKEKLENKKFLLVLDDVWNEDSKKWDSLKSRLQKLCTCSGNFIVVTTRSKVVANAMETSPQHIFELKQLSDDECWSIIKEKFHAKGGESMSKEQESIGIDIARKCRGLPLIAKVLGGTLCSRRTKEEWSSIRSSNVWKATGEDNGILSVLKLSFDSLHSFLKPCFAYCALFPKNFVFKKDKLIQLWMAEGFLCGASTESGTSGRSIEDVGDNYFDLLISNSFFQDVELDVCGNITQCKMHDFLHDLAISVSNSEIIESDDGSTYICSDRRVNIAKCDLRSAGTLASGGAQKLRALFITEVVFSTWPSFESLRSLDMSGGGVHELPTSIGKLKHLRYLDISNNDDISLPKSITNLYNLQTLRLLHCFCDLPINIKDLVNLRHIYFSYEFLMPYKVGCLTNLQILPLFVVGLKEGYKIHELEHLNDLRGELEIVRIERVRDGEEARRGNLNKKKLSILKLKWEREEDESGDDDEVLEGLLPPPSIKSLTIEGYMGKRFPNWMSMEIKDNSDCSSPLNWLVDLRLENCKKCEMMPTLGHLSCLKLLYIRAADGIRSIGNEFYGESNKNVTLFPALEMFTICYMKSLVEWAAPVVTERGKEKTLLIFPSLRGLNIENCPCLTNIPLSHPLNKLVELRLDYCKNLEMLPTLGHLSCLKILYIRAMDGIRSIGNEFYGESIKNMTLFPALQIFTVYYMESLVEWAPPIITETGKQSTLLIFPSLRELRIEVCPSLTTIPLNHLSSLVKLTIGGCGNMQHLSNEFYRFTLLEHLDISNCEGLMSISSLQDLVSLKSMEIYNCPKLTSLPMDLREAGGAKIASLRQICIENCEELSDLSSIVFSSRTCLQVLRITNCSKVNSLPDGLKLCTSLKELTVTHCYKLICIADDIIGSLNQLKHLTLGHFSEELEEFPGFKTVNHLSNPLLEELSLTGWGKIKSLPHQLQFLTSLKKLHIREFPNMEALPDWLGNISSLQKLSIFYCDNLKNLPITVTHLSTLTSLDIRRCRLLEESCAKDSGADWSSISHIAYIKINYDVIEGNGNSKPAPKG